MKLRFELLLFVFVLLIFNNVSATNGGKLKMWYDKPATVWNEALPLGNGRLGAMVYGDPVNEKIQLNEDTFWSGGPLRNDNTDALNALPQVRQLIFDGKFKEAEDLINQSIKAKELHGSMFSKLLRTIIYDGN